MVRAGSVYQYARGRADSTSYRGRARAYAFRTPVSGLHLLVRRAHHGGLLAPLTGDLFIVPGRAPRELEISLRLAERGVPTPALLGYVTYPVIGTLCRIDVLVVFVRDSSDLATLLATERDVNVRAGALEAARALLGNLAAARVRHPDLNLRNILISADGETQRAWLLDVDRVLLDSAPTDEILRMNTSRLERSIRKLQRREGLVLRAGESERLFSIPGTA
jgi:3-deoxy-D-manno-octulosonic acid kinase